MDVHVSLEGRDGLSDQIYRQLREAVLEGRLRVGDVLPPTRRMAAQLSVARGTVSAAYDRLMAEGLVRGRVGAATVVSGTGPATRTAPLGSPLRPLDRWSTLAPWLLPAPARIEVDLRVGLPDPLAFPRTTWRRLHGDVLRRPPDAWVHPAGLPALRAAIARHVGVSRDVRAAADDVLVTSGVQQALDLVGRVLLAPGRCVAVEHPGYPPARLLFASMGMRVALVPVDAEGLRVDALPEDARAVYVTPSHQFPLGMPMSLPRRVALLDWAERHDAVVIEDDYDSEFRFGGRPIEPLQNIDRTGRVLYVGSFSKVLSPGLRTGFLVAPAALHDALHVAKWAMDWHAPALTQAVLARFIEEGLLAAHLRRRQREYAARHEALASGFDRHLRVWFAPVVSVAGLHTSGFTADDPAELILRARDAGLAVHSLAEVAMDEAVRPGVAFGFGLAGPEQIDRGLRQLSGLRLGRAARPTPPPRGR